MSINSIPELNNKIWGIKRRQFVLVAARTSHGKSLFMNQIAWDLADQGKRVLFLSLEMDVSSLQERLFCNVCEVNNTFLLRGGFSNDKQTRDKWDVFVKLMENSTLEYSDQIGRNWDEIDSIVTNLDPKPDVVVLDHINEISSGSARDKRQAIDDYLIHLRALCVKNNFALIVGAQINRSGQGEANKEPKSYQLKESGKLEETADLLLLLYWQHKDDETKNKNLYKIIVSKNRNGWTGSLKAKITPEIYRISDWTETDEISLKARPKLITENPGVWDE